MKKSIITFLLLSFVCLTILICSCIAANAQPPAKKDTAIKKPRYEYFIKMPTADVNQYLQLLKDYRTLVIYEPGRTPDQAVSLQKGIDAYIERFTKSIKLDSVLIKK